MAKGVRLPLTHPRRIREREQKLWRREMTWAIRKHIEEHKPELKIQCPCKLCDRASRKKLCPENVLGHFTKIYGREPRHYGSSMGYDPDKFDDEWDAHIRNHHGLLTVTPRLQDLPDAEDDEYKLTNCVTSTFQMYDAVFRE